MDKLLHITNGDSFTSRLQGLNLPGNILTWREILCEGPATEPIFSEPFNYQRATFLSKFSPEDAANINYNSFADSFYNLDFELYDAVFLWFEYDLFCHINLAAAVHYLSQKDHGTPLYLTCSGKIDDTNRLYGLSELSDNQILEISEERTLLTPLEIKAFNEFWKIYSSEDHSALIDLSFDTRKLSYLTNCIEAHLKRFPKKSTGINSLERMVLEAIATNDFVSEKQLCSHLLKNQKFYGFGDLQWFQIIAKMRPFFTELLSFTLNDTGEALIANKESAFELLKDDTMFGGTSKYAYFYNDKTQQLEAAHVS